MALHCIIRMRKNTPIEVTVVSSIAISDIHSIYFVGQIYYDSYKKQKPKLVHPVSYIIFFLSSMPMYLLHTYLDAHKNQCF